MPISPPDVGHEPHNPVRDDEKLAPTEDLDREPDGVPHRIVGLTALFSVMLAALLVFMFITGGRTTKVAAVLIAIMAVPVIVSSLNAKSERERDHLHPSR
jgi:hypothetical protein